MRDFDIRNYPNLIESLNRVISNGGIAEVKNEPRGVTIVEVVRKVKYREPETK